MHIAGGMLCLFAYGCARWEIPLLFAYICEVFAFVANIAPICAYVLNMSQIYAKFAYIYRHCIYM